MKAPGWLTRRWGLVLVMLCALAPLALHATDAPRRALELRRRLPGLDPRLALHLVRDDDDALARFCEQVGVAEVTAAMGVLADSLYAAESPAAFEERLSFERPLLLRLCRWLEVSRARPEFRAEVEDRTRGPDHGYAVFREQAKLNRIAIDASLPADEKVARCRQALQTFRALGSEWGVQSAEGVLETAMATLADPSGRPAALHQALAHSRRLGDRFMTCQFLGELGVLCRGRGDVDSMLVCYLEGIAIADRYRIPDQSSRLRLFLSRYYRDQGQLSLAADLVREAQSRCRDEGGGMHEVRAVHAAMDLFAILGCWDIVEQLDRRVPLLLRLPHNAGYKSTADSYDLTSRVWDARLLAARGQPAEAARHLERLVPEMRTKSLGRGYGELAMRRAEMLLDAGLAREAAGASEAAVAYADSIHYASVGTTAALTRARAYLEAGDAVRARSALDDLVRRSSLRREDSLATARIVGAFEARIALLRGRPDEARAIMARESARLAGYASTLDRSPESYLALYQDDDLYRAGHLTFAGDARARYEWELDWREQPGSFGRAPAPAGRVPPARTAGSGAANAVRLLYAVRPDAVLRWTAADGRVRLDTLRATPAACRKLVERVVGIASHDPGAHSAAMPAELRDACDELGRLLLPAMLQDGPRPVLVTADGFLQLLSFEILGCAPDGRPYEPLLANHDVAYARPCPPGPANTGAHGSIVLTGTAGNARDESATTGLAPLPNVDDEARAVLRRLPDARLLDGPRVSKADVLRAWSQASVLYVASHLVRDPQAPLLAYFPMSFGARPHHPEDSYLDLHDVLSTDLSGCRLAVLSSCASGEPYVVGSGWAGPSMADAMVDAGAAAVVHTRWRIRDDQAASLAPALAGAWLAGGADPLARWCEERRRRMRGPQGWLHPFEWAAWSVTLRMERPPSLAAAARLSARAATARAALAAPAASPARVR